ncbi:MAG TPA: NifU family protein [Dehalococcoidia bacterium]
MIETAAERSVSDTGAAIEHLLDEIASAGGPQITALAEELVRDLSALYGEGIERMLTVISERAPQPADVIDALAADPVVAGLLSLHGLHPEDPRARIERALERVRPYLGSHGGGVEVLGIDDDAILHLRLGGSCDGCPSSAATIESAIRGAVLDAAPEVAGIAVEMPAPRVSGDIIPLQVVSRATPNDASRWIALDRPPRLTPGRLALTDIDGRALVFARVAAQLYAYDANCPACAGTMDAAALDGTEAACPSCAQSYDLALAGRCSSDASLRLEPVPLLEDEHGVRIAIAVRP